MTAEQILSPLAHELVSLSSYLPIALYAFGFRVRDGLVSVICDKFAAPAAFTGEITDLQSIWSMKQSMLFGDIKREAPSQVLSLRHGNSFPLVNKAVLKAAGCIGRLSRAQTDLAMPRSITVNLTFIIPDKNSRSPEVPAKMLGGLVGILEIIVFVCSGVFQGLYGIYAGSALAGCLAVSTLCCFILQQFEKISYAHSEAIKKDFNLTCKNGAASDIHVVVPDFNAHEMDVLIGYSSQLHSLTNLPARLSRPYLLLWTCRVLGFALVIQGLLLARLVNAHPPALYGSPIWLLGYLATNAIQSMLNLKISGVELGMEPVVLLPAPQVNLPSRRAALAFIASLPMTSSRVDRWDWTDGFLPRNERREAWQREMDVAELSNKKEPRIDLSDDGKRIVTQVRYVRFEKELQKLVENYKLAVGLE